MKFLQEFQSVFHIVQLLFALLQVDPSLKLDAQEYVSLAEKALMSFGMAPAVWLLVQLHQADAIHFYKLPHSTTAVADQGSKTSPADPSSSDTETSKALATSDVFKLARLMDSAADGGHLQSSPKDSSGWKLPCSTVMVFEVTVNVAIIVVLSWAAQLVQREVAPAMLNNDVTFVLGEFLARWDCACMSSVSQH